MENTKIAHEVIDLAGTTLVALEADSDKQRNDGDAVRLAAIADIWQQGVYWEESKTPAFAQALIRAVNRRVSAKWWIDQEPRTDVPGSFIDALRQDLSAVILLQTKTRTIPTSPTILEQFEE